MIESHGYSSTITVAGDTIQYTTPYGTSTFKSLPLKTLDHIPNMDKDKWCTAVPTTSKDWVNPVKRHFTCASLEGSKKMRESWKDISGRADEVINQFMDGSIDKNALADRFQSLSHELYETACRVNYPTPLIFDDEQAVSEAFYDEVRRRILDIAVDRNNEEGKQHITGEMNAQRSWKYYNADYYYYKSEDAIDAVTNGMEEMAKTHNWDFTIPDYKSKGLNLYYNFNTAFSNKFCQSEQYLIDPDMEPPQGFEWFFQTGGDRNKYSTYGVLESKIITNPDGSETEIKLIDRNKFDPTDFYTGNTWFAYTDKSGKRHVFSKDVVFNDQKSDLMNLGNLFKIPVDNEWEKVRGFLGNLQLYPKGYLSRFAKTVNLNCFV